ncbi:MAG: hypothetical protein ACI9XK_003967 [Granulosicoccus sp.]|jgi:hypothetical protein
MGIKKSPKRSLKGRQELRLVNRNLLLRLLLRNPSLRLLKKESFSESTENASVSETTKLLLIYETTKKIPITVIVEQRLPKILFKRHPSLNASSKYPSLILSADILSINMVQFF